MERVLAIESAIAGGSLALVADGIVTSVWHNPQPLSRSEELLPVIASLLENSGLDKAQLTKIAVSNGPGSYTGIRIGLATAMGLARALDIPCVGISLLKAVWRASNPPENSVVVVPIGRGGYAWLFRSSGSEAPFATLAGSIEQLRAFVAERSAASVLAHSDAFNTLASGTAVGPAEIVDLGRDMAAAAGLASLSTDDGLLPVYARDNSSPREAGVSG